MAIIATDGNRFSSVVEREYDPASAFCRDTVVYNGTAVTLQVGAVLGKVTSTGKYKLCEATAADGSQVAAAVVIADILGLSRPQVMVLNTDTQLLAMTRGPVILKKAGLSFGASVTAGALTTAAYAQLTAAGMIPETSI
jgi:hypothetical protein